MTRRINVVALIAGVALAGSLGCTTKQAPPAISGPSELATAITIYASPDTITQDGASQSQITILARDPRNQPIANLPIRLDTAAKGVVADFGQLSSKQLVTGGDGRATTSYTAPNAPQSAADMLSSVTILATPVGADASGTLVRSVTIRLTASVIPIPIPPSNRPTASFTFSPKEPAGDQQVYFNASDSTGPNPIVTYAWDFGDGTLDFGPTPTHRFNGCSTSATNTTNQTFVVRLTVTDSVGKSSLPAFQMNVPVTKCRL